MKLVSYQKIKQTNQINEESRSPRAPTARKNTNK